MAKDMYEDFQWHSATGITKDFGKMQSINKLEASDSNIGKFIRGSNDSDYLVHKTTYSLWKFSEDGSIIEPVFDEDVLCEENM